MVYEALGGEALGKVPHAESVCQWLHADAATRHHAGIAVELTGIFTRYHAWLPCVIIDQNIAL